MENYLRLNNEKINLTPGQVEQLKKSYGFNNIMLKDVKAGETFKVGGLEFIVLEQSGDTTTVILKELLLENKQFKSNNDYKNSNVDDICNEFGKVISQVIGAENLIEHTVDLTSDDGLKDYGTIKRKMSLITANMYRRYVEILDKHKVKKWWWLATAYSTPKHENATWVKCVSPGGDIGDYFCNGLNCVRPFCILKSNIFVSK